MSDNGINDYFPQVFNRTTHYLNIIKPNKISYLINITNKTSNKNISTYLINLDYIPEFLNFNKAARMFLKYFPKPLSEKCTPSLAKVSSAPFIPFRFQ